MKERINKVLGNAGVASRRQVEQMVLEGRISVNGRVVRELPVLVDVAKDRVEVDGEAVRLAPAQAEKRYYVLLNKPKGVVSTNVAQGVQTRAIDLISPRIKARVYPVGRLDAESRGLLLLTNDGDLTNRLTHPRYGVPKTYRAVVDGYVGPEVLREVQEGVWLADREGKGFKTGRTFTRIVRRTARETILEVTLREGRNREVRRVLAKLGHKVRDLMRIRFGSLTLEGLKPGESRLLTPREVKALQKSADASSEGSAPAARPRRNKEARGNPRA